MRFTITDDEGNSFSAVFDICKRCGYICPEQMSRQMSTGEHYCPNCWHKMNKVVYTQDMMNLTIEMVTKFMETMTKTSNDIGTLPIESEM